LKIRLRLIWLVKNIIQAFEVYRVLNLGNDKDRGLKLIRLSLALTEFGIRNKRDLTYDSILRLMVPIAAAAELILLSFRLSRG
jgi:hypothetical protein